jgi:hypothetical protein
VGRLVLDRPRAGRAFNFGMVTILARCQDNNVQVARRATGAAIASKWQPRHLGPEGRRLLFRQGCAAPSQPQQLLGNVHGIRAFGPALSVELSRKRQSIAGLALDPSLTLHVLG